MCCNPHRMTPRPLPPSTLHPVRRALRTSTLTLAMSGTRFECDWNNRHEYRMLHKEKRSNVAIITSEPLTENMRDWVVRHDSTLTSAAHSLTHKSHVRLDVACATQSYRGGASRHQHTPPPHTHRLHQRACYSTAPLRVLHGKAWRYCPLSSSKWVSPRPPAASCPA